MGVHRRDVLETGVAIGTLGIAGCLGGFETQSAWRDPPLVEDRPDAVYVPASFEEMATYGMATAGEYTIGLMYTFPHRFWTITGQQTNLVEITDDDSLHLMVSLADAQTGTTIPTDVRMTLEGEGTDVTPYQGQLWPMITQTMGFHYGDNVAISDEGTYTATLEINPVTARRTGDLAGRFKQLQTAELTFEYSSDDIYDLEFSLIDEGRWGERGALDLMDHEMPAPTVPPAEEFPGTVIGTDHSGDAEFVIAVLERERFGKEAYLAISPRTPHNRVVLPSMSLSVTITRNGERVFEAPLESTLDSELDFHYGTEINTLNAGDTLTVTIESVPQLARHDGYETAFMEMSPVEVTYSP